MLEREIKLQFDSIDLARHGVLSPGVGATPLRARRLQQDILLDSEDNRLLDRRSALRVRRESGGAVLTFKGPPQASAMKVREEHETVVTDGDTLITILGELGWRPWFRYEKYREEFSAQHVIIAIDETPIGVYVEIEGSEEHIHATARALGKTSHDYLTASYRALYVSHCRAHGTTPTDMLFP
jgi:adenylate cyclase class 2